MQRLEELVEWQRQQQEKLRRQQEEQRELLNLEQKRIFEVFGCFGAINVNNMCCDSDPKKSLDLSLDDVKGASYIANADDSLTSYTVNNNSDNFNELLKGNQGNEELIEVQSCKIMPLKSSNTEVPKTVDENSTIIVDDIPIQSSKRDFNELVQEKLELERNRDCINDNILKTKPKHNFLRKGEGLARFGMKLESNTISKQGSKYRGKLKHSKPQSQIISVPKQINGKCNTIPMKRKEMNVHLSKFEGDRDRKVCPQVKSQDKNLKGSLRLSPISKLKLKSVEKKQDPPATWAHVLQQPVVCQGVQDLVLEVSSQEFDKKSKKELEELRVFELLEQHAANSSFCSTSSLVAHLMGDSVKSTPVKLNLKRHIAFNQTQQNKLLDNHIASEISRVEPHRDHIMSFPPTFNNAPHVTLDESEEFQKQFEKYDQFQTRQLYSSMGQNDIADLQHKAQARVSENQCQVTNIENGKPFISSTGIGKRQNLSVRFSVCSNTPLEREVDNYDKSTNGINKNCNLESVLEEVVQISGKEFQDEQVWSDMCSCTSCEASDSDCSLNCDSVNQSSRETCNNKIERNNVNSDQKSLKAGSIVDSSYLNANISPQLRANNHEVLTAADLVTLQNIPGHSDVNTNIKHITQDELSTQRQREDDRLSFKSALLKDRLQELEKEIEIFQKENSNLLKIKKQHEEEVTKYKKEKKEMERKISEEQKQLEDTLQGERRKLAKEKMVFEKYCKDLKNQPTRQEREEIQILKLQVASLQEELIKKDSRWSALQVRSNDRLRQLDKDITRLKEENEKLKQEKEKVKKVRFSNSRLKGSNTKALHAINKQIGKIKAADMDDIVIRNVVPKKRIPSSILSQKCSSVSNEKTKSDLDKVNEWGHKANGNRCFVDVPDMRPDSSTDEIEEDISTNNPDNSGTPYVNVDSAMPRQYSEDTHLVENYDGYRDDVNCSDTFKDTEDDDKLLTTVYDAFYSTLEEMTPDNMDNQDDRNNKISSNIHRAAKGVNGYNHLLQLMTEGQINARNFTNNSLNKTESEENVLREVTGVVAEPETSGHSSSKNNPEPIIKQSNKETFVETISSNGTLEKVFPDGRQEIWYPNGNVKKVSADNSVIKIIYYNGDVKEKFLNDGMEKYYYAETKTWHTTYLDGLDVLEFPNGQMERRQKDGTTEITYVNGSVQLCHPDGREEWSLPDGTVTKIGCSGDKLLLLPNGQREIHTIEHKRREYPDGTVKFLYPDGLQETRYANGRIRLKDKDGKLVMDSAAA